MRPIHYPPITQEPDDAVRAAAHGDINLTTLLMGSQGKGFQLQNHKGEWIDAIAQPDELMINVRDMLSIHTNNKLKSTIHTVINPPREFKILYSFLYASCERNVIECFRKLCR